jgi:hypothetical protein
VIKVAHYGLGPIGLAVAGVSAERSWLRPVAAVDVRAELHGRLLSDLTGRPMPESPAVTAEYPLNAGADVVLHCTSSSLERVAPQLLDLIRTGLDVVSTTEELSYPWAAHPEVAAEIDEAARAAGVTVLGTGVNPGYAMDYLALVLSAVAQRVDAIAVHRVQDAGTRRLPLQRKVGAGMDADAFRRAVAEGRLGHVGLAESAHLLAAVFGWRLTALHERVEPILATEPTPISDGTVDRGHVLGIHHVVEADTGLARVISLTLDMAVGIGPPGDRVRLTGAPNLELQIPGGVHGDVATAAIVVNAVPRVLAAPPGLVTMADLAPPTPGPPRADPALGSTEA